MAEARTLLENALHGPAAALFVFACLVWGSAAVWTIVAWGAFRNSFGCGRVKAILATTLWAAMLLIPMQMAVDPDADGNVGSAQSVGAPSQKRAPAGLRLLLPPRHLAAGRAPRG